MATSFAILEPLCAPEAMSLDELLQRIDRGVSERSEAYVQQLLVGLRRHGTIPTWLDARAASDPYFIGAAFGRLRFDPSEVLRNLEFVLTTPSTCFVNFPDPWDLLVVECDDEEAGRETYCEANGASRATCDRIEMSCVTLARQESFARLVKTGVKRLALSDSCVASSSISSLPGFALVGSGSGSSSLENRTINGLVHEAVHGVLFMAEGLVGRELIRSGEGDPIISPWSGNPLDPYQFVQAVFVWRVLLGFWLGADPDSPECATAARGFVDRGAAHALHGIQHRLAADVSDLLHSICEDTHPIAEAFAR